MSKSRYFPGLFRPRKLTCKYQVTEHRYSHANLKQKQLQVHNDAATLPRGGMPRRARSPHHARNGLLHTQLTSSPPALARPPLPTDPSPGPTPGQRRAPARGSSIPARIRAESPRPAATPLRLHHPRPVHPKAAKAIRLKYVPANPTTHLKAGPRSPLMAPPASRRALRAGTGRRRHGHFPSHPTRLNTGFHRCLVQPGGDSPLSRRGSAPGQG